MPADDPVVARLRRLSSRADEMSADLKTGQLFSETADFLADLAAAGPLLLLLDDLQWADAGSVNLLYHLARGLSHARILIVSAYRPEEVAADGALGRSLAEIKRLYGDAWIELDALIPDEGRAFIDALLDAASNALGLGFRAALHAHTGGHTLFTAETLRHLRETGFLGQDAGTRLGRGAAGGLDGAARPRRGGDRGAAGPAAGRSAASCWQSPASKGRSSPPRPSPTRWARMSGLCCAAWSATWARRIAWCAG